MIKKVIGWTLLVVLVDVLVVGAMNRTLAKTDEPLGLESGNRRGQQKFTAQVESEQEPCNETGNLQGEARGKGLGQGLNQSLQAEAASRSGGGGYGNQGKAGGENFSKERAEVKTWVTLEGTIQRADATALIVNLNDEAGLVEILNRAWAYAQSAGFSAEVGDMVRITGFYDQEGKFEARLIENLTSGQSVTLRDEGGRPMWAGRGRWG